MNFMSTKHFLFFAIIFWMNQANGQTFQAGLVAGFNMTQVDGDDLGGYNRIVVAGGRADARLADKWKLSFEILFSQMGSDRSKYDFGSDYDNIRMNGVEVPVSLIFRDWLVDDGDDSFYRIEFAAGFSYYRLMNFKVEAFTGEDVSDFKDYNPNSFLVNLGATWFINPKFGIHAHWAKALNDLDNAPEEVLLARNISVKGIYIF